MGTNGGLRMLIKDVDKMFLKKLVSRGWKSLQLIPMGWNVDEGFGFIEVEIGT